MQWGATEGSEFKKYFSTFFFLVFEGKELNLFLLFGRRQRGTKGVNA